MTSSLIDHPKDKSVRAWYARKRGAMILAAAGLLAIGAFLQWGPIGLGNGPLSTGMGYGQGAVHVGSPVGLVIPILNSGGSPAVVDGLDLIGGTSYPGPHVLGLEVLTSGACLGTWPVGQAVRLRSVAIVTAHGLLFLCCTTGHLEAGRRQASVWADGGGQGVSPASCHLRNGELGGLRRENIDLAAWEIRVMETPAQLDIGLEQGAASGGLPNLHFHDLRHTSGTLSTATGAMQRRAVGDCVSELRRCPYTRR